MAQYQLGYEFSPLSLIIATSVAKNMFEILRIGNTRRKICEYCILISDCDFTWDNLIFTEKFLPASSKKRRTTLTPL